MTTETLLKLSTVKGEVQHLVEAGMSLHWLRPNSKAPIVAHWSSLPVLTMEGLVDTHTTNANIGIRLGEFSKTPSGFVYLIDLDIRDDDKLDEALSALSALLPDSDDLPVVASGSGGASRHFYFMSPKLLRSKKLAKSDTFTMVFDATKGRDVKKNDWEIELFGTGKQAVLPPSIHPDTKQPYRWVREFDLSLLDLGIGPVLADEIVEAWAADAFFGIDDPDDEDDLMLLLGNSPLDISYDEVKSTLDGLPNSMVDDRDGWLEVGQALHHQFEGSEIGYELWIEWSQTSEKFDDRDQRKVWASFKNKTKHKKTMKSLIKTSNEEKKRVKDIEKQEDREARIKEFVEKEVHIEEFIDLLDEPATASKTKLILPPIPRDEDWRENMMMDSRGMKLEVNDANVVAILRNDQRFANLFAFNEMTAQSVIVKDAPMTKDGSAYLDNRHHWSFDGNLNGREIGDHHALDLTCAFSKPNFGKMNSYGMNVSKNRMLDCIETIARERSYHPVKHYMEGLVWDGKPRVETLFIRYLGAEDNAYHREVASKTMLALVARVYEPGCKFDHVIVLEGGQGKRKSTFIRKLAVMSDWFAELQIDISDVKAVTEIITGKWLVEIPELSALRKADSQALKQRISAAVDRFRAAYARSVTSHLRSSVFFASTNDEKYLKDPTGNRRYWPVKCQLDGMIDTDAIEQERNQLWAEALSLYRAMRDEMPLMVGGMRTELNLSLQGDDARKIAEEYQGSRVEESEADVAAEFIGRWLAEPEGSDFDDLPGQDHVPPRGETMPEITVEQVCTKAYGLRDGEATMQRRRVIGTALRQLGWSESVARRNGTIVRLFRKPTP